MTTPKWLIPTVSVAATIALGAAALFVGAQFAAPQAVTSVAATESVPVLLPQSDEPAPATDLGTVATSAVGGIRTVTEPGAVSADAVDPALAAELGRLGAMSDPGGAEEAAESRSATTDASAGSGTDDPCSAIPAPDDCPDGVRAVLTGGHLSMESFLLTADTYPPLPDSGSTSYFACAAPATAPGPDDLPLTIVATAPATIEVDYYPLSDPSHPVHLELHSSDADTAAFQDGLAAYRGPDGGYSHVINHCAVLPGLAPLTDYRMHITATDFLGREATLDTNVRLRDLRQRPPTRIMPVGTSTVFASAARTPGQELEFLAFSLPDDAAATCAAAIGSGTLLHPLGARQSTTIDAATLAAGDYLPDYTVRESQSFGVPEGTRIVVCVRWYTAGAGPDHAGTPIFQSQYAMRSPDIMHPSVSLARIDYHHSLAAGSVQIQTSFPDGSPCSGVPLPAADVTVTGAVLSQDYDLGLCSFDDARTAYLGDPGDLVVTTAVTSGGHTATNSVDLPFGSLPCVQGCGTAPAPQYFEVPLATTTIGTGLCGSSFGDCDPPTADVAAGTAVLKVEWVEGPSSGQRDWNLGPWTEGDYDDAPPAEIQLAQDEAPTIAWDSPTAYTSLDLGYHLVTDRPVRYTAELIGDCSYTGRPLTASSTALQTDTHISIDGLCPGWSYFLKLTLVAADGTTTVWQHLQGGRFWPQGFVYTPGVPGKLLLGHIVTQMPEAYTRGTLDFQVNGLEHDGPDYPSSTCTNYDLQTPDVFRSEALSYRGTYDVRVRAIGCDDGRLLEADLTTGEVTLADLQRGITLTSDPASGYTLSVQLLFVPDRRG